MYTKIDTIFCVPFCPCTILSATIFSDHPTFHLSWTKYCKSDETIALPETSFDTRELLFAPWCCDGMEIGMPKTAMAQITLS